MPFRVYATCDIGEAALNRLRERGYQIDVYPNFDPPSKSLILQKVRSGVDGLITTLRDSIDADLFEAGKGRPKVIAQIAGGLDKVNREDANRITTPSSNNA